ncbi:MAG: hypothetical protein PUP93_21590 [Rhizonema sp. NSF051]|nr:hypothetical protein [Rhizonema sp. NSF051]
MSSHPSSSTKINKIRKRNPNAHTVEREICRTEDSVRRVSQNLADALELELLASEASERSDYLHMAYSNY